MLFAIMGGSLSSSSSVTQAVTSSATQNGVTLDDGGASLTACAAKNSGSITTIALINASGGETIQQSGNYTFTGCTLTGVGASAYNGTTVNSSYSYTHTGTAFSVINQTTTSIASVTTFFSLFIVIGSMVVLVLLTVIIVVAIRQSGMLSGATA